MTSPLRRQLSELCRDVHERLEALGEATPIRRLLALHMRQPVYENSFEMDLLDALNALTLIADRLGVERKPECPS